ncbi:MAG: AAA family ATPase [Proteobacteria bacterium]|nr:AAA family ATPase [Pseudomonadota bacterium]
MTLSNLDDGRNIMPTLPESIEALSRVLLEVQATAQRVKGGLIPYISNDLFIARPWELTKAAKDNTGNPTAAAFSIYLLTKAGQADEELGRLGPKASQRILEEVRTSLISSPSTIKSALERTNDSEAPKTDTQQLPNNYNTPILLAGVLAAVNSGAQLDADLLKGCGRQLDWLMDQIKRNIGYLQSLSSADYGLNNNPHRPVRHLPSAAHTFWAAAALTEALTIPGLGEERIVNAQSAISEIGAWAERATSEMLAWHLAGVQSRFDVVDTICAAALIYRCSVGRDARKLADKAVAIVFEEYFEDGQITKSRPIVADRVHNRSIFCSTYEALSYLYCSTPARPELGEPLAGPLLYWRKAAEVVGRIASSWISGRGIPNDQDAHYEVASTPTSFSTSAAMATVSFVKEAIEAVSDNEAKRELGVARPVGRHQEYPKHLKRIVNNFILNKSNAKDDEDREKAFYSMIWFGPPGTGKTSFAKKIASDLGWSFLQITQKDFLREGNDLIDACAERIFKLLLNIRETVVLFDELEELVQAREPRSASDKDNHGTDHPDSTTRRLTTSMLPRIHDLRDRAKVVFIFATNRLRSFDPAATRLGRFDAIVPLAPLSTEQRKAIFDDLIKDPKHRLQKNAQTLISKVASEAGFPAAFKGMIYKDIEFVVRQVSYRVEEGEKFDSKAIGELFEATESISSTVLEDFERLCETAQRPKYYKFDE